MMLLPAGYSGREESQNNAEHYAVLIFNNTHVHTINTTMSQADRAYQPANPKDMTKYKAEAVIDGEEIKDVGFRTKGNPSLYFTAAPVKTHFTTR